MLLKTDKEKNGISLEKILYIHHSQEVYSIHNWLVSKMDQVAVEVLWNPSVDVDVQEFENGFAIIGNEI